MESLSKKAYYYVHQIFGIPFCVGLLQLGMPFKSLAMELNQVLRIAAALH